MENQAEELRRLFEFEQKCTGRKDDFRYTKVVDIIDAMTCDRIADEFYERFGINLAEVTDTTQYSIEAVRFLGQEFNKTVEMFKVPEVK